MLAALSGCVSDDPGVPSGPSGPGTFMNHAMQGGGPPSAGPNGAHCSAQMLNGAPGLVGPGGVPVMAMATARLPEATPESLAFRTVAEGLPPGVAEQLDKSGRRRSDIQQMSANMPADASMGGLMQAGGPMMGPPPGMCGPNGCPPGAGPLAAGPPGAVAAVGALTGPAACPFPVQRTSVRFTGPSGMKISWFGPTANGQPGFGGEYLTAPGRYNFLQAAIYRLKLTEIPQRQGMDLYPTLEVVPVNAKTSTFLAHSSVPVNITEEDLNQVAAGNFVVKVIYLPDPQYQDLASTGAEEIISSRMEPGADPIAEALRRGSILLIVRLGNILLELPNTPPMDAPSPFQARGPLPPGPGGPGMPGMAMPQGMAGPGGGPMPPFGLTGNPRQDMMPPGMMPPGMMPPGMMPPGMMPGGMMPPGMMPPGMMPPGMMPPGMMPPTSATPPGRAQAVATPTARGPALPARSVEPTPPARVPQELMPRGGSMPLDLMPRKDNGPALAPGIPVGQMLPTPPTAEMPVSLFLEKGK